MESLPSLTLGLALCIVSQFSHALPPRSFLSSVRAFNQQKAAADLLSFLGSRDQAAMICDKEAEGFRCRLRFLVPFSPSPEIENFQRTSVERRVLFDQGCTWSKTTENRLVWWPPQSVMDLARRSIDSGGDPESIRRGLDSTTFLAMLLNKA